MHPLSPAATSAVAVFNGRFTSKPVKRIGFCLWNFLRQAPCKAGRAGLTQFPPRKRVPLSSIYLFEVAWAQWLSVRQTAIAGNVANANTPGYRAVDIQPFAAVLDASPIEMAATSGAHLSPPE